ncbi:hypothetical protein BLOT_009120 [Blomia tropicalis]|nr:hypothetical protein BLOT_009120 [Blomia tropicalis]
MGSKCLPEGIVDNIVPGNKTKWCAEYDQLGPIYHVCYGNAMSLLNHEHANTTMIECCIHHLGYVCVKKKLCLGKNKFLNMTTNCTILPNREAPYCYGENNQLMCSQYLIERLPSQKNINQTICKVTPKMTNKMDRPKVGEKVQKQHPNILKENLKTYLNRFNLKHKIELI